MGNLKDFIKGHHKYYQVLENDFIKTLPYVELNVLNFSTYSIEFLKQLQTICSEIDVVLKYYCELLGATNVKNIKEYASVVLVQNSVFQDTTIDIDGIEDNIQPWLEWSYTNNGNYSSPSWWSDYNKLKHDRVRISSGTDNYIKANMKNVLFALAALYILNEYVYKMICRDEDEFYGELPNSSNLFSIKGWQYDGVYLNKNFRIDF